MRLNQSLWFEQIDTAWADYLTSRVKVMDSEGNLVGVPVRIRKPDADFRVEEYPCVTIYNLFTTAAPLRYAADKVVVARNGNLCTLEEAAKPFDLSYQIDFWSSLQVDMNQMVGMWLSHYWKSFEMPAKNAAGADVFCTVMERDAARKMDVFQPNERKLFRTTFTYKVSGYLDFAEKENVPMVTNVVAEVHSWEE